MKIYRNQLFTFDNGEEIFIDVTVEEGIIKDIIAAEDYKGFKKGDIINIDGDESLIRAEDIEIDFLNK